MDSRNVPIKSTDPKLLIRCRRRVRSGLKKLKMLNLKCLWNIQLEIQSHWIIESRFQGRSGCRCMCGNHLIQVLAEAKAVGEVPA